MVFCVMKKGWDNVEKRDLYDANKKLTGRYIYADDKVPKDYYFLVVVIFIRNIGGKFLMQKTSVQKGNKWATTGGHPKMGETSFEGIVTEVKEELGINIIKYNNDIKLFKTIKDEDCFIDLYYLEADIDINSLVLQESEVEEVSYLTEKEIDELIRTDQFKDSHAKMYNDCIEYLKK